MITVEEVGQFLREHPDFFENHPELLAGLNVSHPQDGRAVSIVERQVLSLREKNSSLEAKLRELIIFGSHNDVLADKLHRLTLALLRADDIDSTLGVLIESMKTDFAIPQAAVRWWDGKGPTQSKHTAFEPTSDGMQDYVSGLRAPYVGPLAAHESKEWLPPGFQATSFAYVPLRTQVCSGVLMLASEDSQRFASDMATDVLTRLGEFATVSIERYVSVPTLQIA
jgi:uncharacterized protein